MQVTSFGRFTQYTVGNYLLYKNELNQDWNELQMVGDGTNPPLVELGSQGEFIDSTYDLWVLVSDDNIITNVDTDPSKLVPNDKVILGLIDVPEGIALEGMLYANGMISEPPVAPEGPYQLTKTVPWKRMTDEEADQAYVALRAAPARQQAIYDAATYIGSDDELFPLLLSILTGLFGEERANELLAKEQV